MNNRQIKNSGCLLLCGGQSRRMGTDKAKLTISGRSFLHIMADKLRQTGLPCYLSLAARREEIPEGFTAVYDEIKDPDHGYAGPLGGIYTALKQAGRDGLEGLYVVPVDAPLFETILFERLSQEDSDTSDIRVFLNAEGRPEPLFGYYSTKVTGIIEELISAGNYRLRSLLQHPLVRTTIIPADKNEESMMRNINDPASYAALLKTLSKDKTHLFIQGQRGCGKTTLIRTVLAETDLSIGGFATKAVRNQKTGEREIYMYPACRLKEETDQESTAMRYGQCIGTAENGIKTVKTDVFDSYGTALLHEAGNAQLIIMDELGTMETEAAVFTRTVLHVLDQNVPVLGVLKTAEKSSPFLEAVRSHDNAEVIELSAQNREEVTIRVRQWLQENGGYQ